MTDRQTKILEIVNQKKKVEVATLSQMLEVSQVTIRKDLDALEELNFLTREHGYATMKNMSAIVWLFVMRRNSGSHKRQVRSYLMEKRSWWNLGQVVHCL